MVREAAGITMMVVYMVMGPMAMVRYMMRGGSPKAEGIRTMMG